MSEPVCTVCGQAVINGNLYCSHACGDGKVSNSATAKELLANGFTPDRVTPNIMVKDGVAVTLDWVSKIGLDQALKQHAQAVK